MSARGQHVGEGCTGPGTGLAVGRAPDGERDYDALTTCARRLKAVAPEGELGVVITASSDTRYGVEPRKSCSPRSASRSRSSGPMPAHFRGSYQAMRSSIVGLSAWALLISCQTLGDEPMQSAIRTTPTTPTIATAAVVASVAYVEPPATEQMTVPGPLAFQCMNDLPCGTHHCNIQYGKCAFPCQSAIDCVTPNQCVAGLCVPAPGP